MSFLIRTVPSVLESHQIGRGKRRGSWTIPSVGIFTLPQRPFSFNFTYIVCCPGGFVNSLTTIYGNLLNAAKKAPPGAACPASAADIGKFGGCS